MNEISIGRIRKDKGIVVGRPSALGNPFVIGDPYTRAESISRYRVWLATEVQNGNAKVHKALEKIVAAARKSDITLLCNCAPRPCHAEVIAEYVRRTLGAEIADGFTWGVRRVFDRLVRGGSAQSIAEDLGISPFTVSNHTRVIFDAFGRNSRSEIVALFATPPMLLTEADYDEEEEEDE